MKRFLANALVVVLMLTMLTFSVSADSNHQDTYFSSFRIEADVLTLLGERREKMNDSSVYVLVDPLMDNTLGVHVATYGFAPGSSTPINKTVSRGQYTDYVTCIKGVEYGIHNWIYENELPMATLGFMSIENIDVIYGRWSPDSVGDLTIAH